MNYLKIYKQLLLVMLNQKSYKLISEYSEFCVLPFAPRVFYVLPSLPVPKRTKYLGKSIC